MPKRPCSFLVSSWARATGHKAELAQGLAAAALKYVEVLVAIGLDAIRVDVHHQGSDLAAGSGADHRRDMCEGH